MPQRTKKLLILTRNGIIGVCPFDLDEGSGVGQLLKALLGYNGNPSLTEVVAYVGYWLIILTAFWLISLRTRQAAVVAKTG